MDEPKPEANLSQRLAYLRHAVFGPRGRAAFARAIGVSPSTYNYYEKGRPAPADLLARAAEVTGADPAWLLTGTGSPFPTPVPQGGDTVLSQHAQEILARLPAGSGNAGNAAARAALRALLASMDAALPRFKAEWRPGTFLPKPTSIPIVGRTAAGLLAPWDRFFAGQEDPAAIEQLLRHTEGRTAHQREGDLRSADPHRESDHPRDTMALLTQLSAPTPEGIVEFLDLPGAGPLGLGTFALRVDGDSMAPRLLDGDLVVSRRDAAPQAGMMAIVKVRDRIGVTAKLWRPEGDRVHLVPINEAHEPAVYHRSEIAWACRVLWVVRL